MSDLSPEARALLAAAADGDDPTSADRDRVARALAIPLGITALVPATAQAAGGALASATGFTVAKVVTAGVLVLGLVGGAAVRARRERAQSVVAASGVVVRQAVLPVAPIARAAPLVPEAVTPPPALAVMPSEARPTIRRARPGSAVNADSLRAESELIAAAHRALLRGDATEALARIADYDARFPRGTLREERDLERLLALCAAGRRSESLAAARRFLRSFPDSPSASRAASACAETNPSRDGSPSGTQSAQPDPAAPERTE